MLGRDYRSQSGSHYQLLVKFRRYQTSTIRPHRCSLLVGHCQYSLHRSAQGFGVLHLAQQAIDLVIHDVNNDLSDKDNGGIFFEITGSSTVTTFNDFLIEGCYIHDIDVTGISNKSSWDTRSFTTNTDWYPSTNVVIRNNTI